jgi:hypothetical protein
MHHDCNVRVHRVQHVQHVQHVQYVQPDWNILRSALSIDTWSSKARLAVGTPDVPARSERHLALNVLAPPAATKQESSVICEEKMFQYFEIFAQTPHTKTVSI